MTVPARELLPFFPTDSFPPQIQLNSTLIILPAARRCSLWIMLHSPPSFICVASYLFILSFIHTHTGALSLSNEMTRVAVVTGANKVRQLLDMNDKMELIHPPSLNIVVVPLGHWIRHRTASSKVRYANFHPICGKGLLHDEYKTLL